MAYEELIILRGWMDTEPVSSEDLVVIGLLVTLISSLLYFFSVPLTGAINWEAFIVMAVRSTAIRDDPRISLFG